jgi:Fe-S-cluster containining protein
VPDVAEPGVPQVLEGPRGLTPAEAALAHIYAQLPTVACQRKCGKDICGPIVAFPTERRRIDAAAFPLQLHYRLAGTRSTCGLYQPDPDRCRVHAHRPLLCRLWGVVDDPKMRCHYGCQPTFWVTNAQVAAWLNELGALDGAPRLGVCVR